MLVCPEFCLSPSVGTKNSAACFATFTGTDSVSVQCLPYLSCLCMQDIKLLPLFFHSVVGHEENGKQLCSGFLKTLVVL